MDDKIMAADEQVTEEVIREQSELFFKHLSELAQLCIKAIRSTYLAATPTNLRR
jgi:hypothetical protein